MSTRSPPGCTRTASTAGYILNREERAMVFADISALGFSQALGGYWEDTGCREEPRC